MKIEKKQTERTFPRFKGKVITDVLAGDITRVEELAYILKIEDVMTSDVKTLSPTHTMQDLMDMLRENHISGVPVVDEGKNLVGLVSTEDLIRSLAKQEINQPVSEYMSTDIVSVNSFDHLTEALKQFAKIKVGRLPVLNAKRELVGIITKGDVNYGLLRALEHDYQEEEVRRYRASHLFEDIESDRTSLILRYQIERYDFTHGGAASSNIKRALLRMGANPQLARRIGIAVYEAEMNLIIHTLHGGSIHVEIEPQKISAYIWDDGPGIQDVEQARQPGFSTATEEIRELGFGAGMGLFNIQKCVDKMDFHSELGKGTHLTMKFYLKGEDMVGESFNKKSEETNES